MKSWGDELARSTDLRVRPPVADMTALKGLMASESVDGTVVMVLSGTGGGLELWRYSPSSAAADTTENLVATPTDGVGRWLRADRQVLLKLPFDFNTADVANLYTVPAGARIHPRESWWDVATSFTGGASSAIGLHTSVTGWTTKGDILGGAAGDVAATLVSTNTRQVGTVGALLSTRTNARLILIAADTIKFGRITSAFTAGVGSARILCDVLSNPGA